VSFFILLVIYLLFYHLKHGIADCHCTLTKCVVGPTAAETFSGCSSIETANREPWLPVRMCWSFYRKSGFTFSSQNF